MKFLRPSSAKSNSEDSAKVFAALDVLGIGREIFFNLLEERDELPVNFWIHDANRILVYGNSFFKETYGHCLKRSCHQCLMGEKNICTCCQSDKALASFKAKKCSVCKRNGYGYDINVLHSPIITRDRSFILTSYLHLEATDDVDRLLQQQEDADTLSFLVRCSACNRTKDSSGNWVGMDTIDCLAFKISHGICPECTRLLYPGLGGSIGDKNSAED